MARVIGSCLLVGVLSGVLWANDFAGGTGEPNDPYQIATAEQLLRLEESSFRDKHFILIADIDMRTAWPYEGIEYFLGTLDGQGHTIRNLTLVSGDGCLGLFGGLGYRWNGRNWDEVESDQDNIRISNLIIEDAYVTNSGGAVGVLAGVSRGIVVNCHVSGTVLTGTSGTVGGLIGCNYGEVLMSTSDCSVDGYWATGGLVGWNYGTVAQCQSHGDVNGVDSVGGLIGSNEWNVEPKGLIQSCSSDAMVSGKSEVGGLVGYNSGTLCFSQADGIVFGLGSVGGLVGVNQTCSKDSQSPKILNSCSTGIVLFLGSPGHDMGYIGSLVGDNQGLVSDCYSYAISPVYSYGSSRFIGKRSGRVQRCLTLSDLYGSESVKSCYALGFSNYFTEITWEQMEDPDTFVGWDFFGRSDDGLLDDWFISENDLLQLTWQVEDANRIPVPLLRGESVEAAQRRLDAAGLCLGEIHFDYCEDKYLDVNSIITTRPYSYASRGQAVDLIVNLGCFDWRGDISEFWEIETPGQLDCLLVWDPWPGFYTLTADLDMTGWVYRKPLFDGVFEGVFDGQGHAIKNLVIDQLYAEDPVGLFKEIGKNGYVGNLMLDALSVSGNDYVGSVAGLNEGMIQGVTVVANVTGDEVLGGLVGANTGSLVDCHVTGRINSLSGDHDSAGQLAGCGEEESYFGCTAEVECPSIDEALELVGRDYCGSGRSGR